MADTFKNVVEQDNPAARWFLVAPSDTVAFPIMPRAIYCTVAGTAQMVDEAGTVMPVAMAAGELKPFRPFRINATSTTGTFYGLF